MSRAHHWCFTLNNYTADDLSSILEFSDTDAVEYLVVGRETGDSGTPHLQGYISFGTRRRLPFLRANLSERAHFEVSRGTPTQASNYCKKDGNFEERGTLPSPQGRRTDIDRFKSWVLEYVSDNGRGPSEREIALEHSSLWVRYPERVVSLASMLSPPPVLVNGELKPWQDELYQEIDDGMFSDREIHFIVDREGGKGKSWFCRYVISKKPDDAQLLSIGKRDDLAHAIDVSKSIFLFNIPRGQMEYLRYEVLEQMKDRMIFSPKYNSQTKILAKVPFVGVFSNEMPDESKMTEDRYNIKYL